MKSQPGIVTLKTATCAGMGWLKAYCFLDGDAWQGCFCRSQSAIPKYEARRISHRVFISAVTVIVRMLLPREEDHIYLAKLRPFSYGYSTGVHVLYGFSQSTSMVHVEVPMTAS
jgi:hypothetical protein